MNDTGIFLLLGFVFIGIPCLILGETIYLEMNPEVKQERIQQIEQKEKSKNRINNKGQIIYRHFRVF
jgi:hypothetical protein